MPPRRQSITNCCTSVRVRRFHTAVLHSPFITPLEHTNSTARTDALVERLQLFNKFARKSFESIDHCLINALTGQVDAGSNMSGYPT